MNPFNIREAGQTRGIARSGITISLNPFNIREAGQTGVSKCPSKCSSLNPFNIREAGQTLHAIYAECGVTSQSLQHQGSRSD